MALTGTAELGEQAPWGQGTACTGVGNAQTHCSESAPPSEGWAVRTQAELQGEEPSGSSRQQALRTKPAGLGKHTCRLRYHHDTRQYFPSGAWRAQRLESGSILRSSCSRYSSSATWERDAETPVRVMGR